MSTTPSHGHEPFFLMEPGTLAKFKEWIEEEEVGWGTLEVLSLERGPALSRVVVEQADSRGDRYRYHVIQTTEGVAAEIYGENDLVVHDWIWRFPLEERSWTEDVEGMTVSYQLYRLPDPVKLPAGSFENCWRLTTVTPQGTSAHTYHPSLGLILSEFSDAQGTPGRRELYELERKASS